MRSTNLSVAFLFPLIGLLMIPFLLFAMLAGGILPATWLLERWRRAPRLIRSLGSAIAVAEGHSAALIRQRFIAIVALFFYSLAIWVAMVGEYWLSLHFLGVKANLSQTLLALTAARLAFLTPLPGGMGALEAAQVIAFQTIGLGAALGMSLSLLQRARDLFLALLGIVFGSLLHLRSPLTLRPQPSSET